MSWVKGITLKSEVLIITLNYINYLQEGILLLQVDPKSLGICRTFHPKTREELSTWNEFKGTVGNKSCWLITPLEFCLFNMTATYN